MITKDEITEIFYIIDEFSSIFDAEIEKRHLLSTTGKARRMRKASLSDSENSIRQLLSAELATPATSSGKKKTLEELLPIMWVNCAVTVI